MMIVAADADRKRITACQVVPKNSAPGPQDDSTKGCQDEAKKATVICFSVLFVAGLELLPGINILILAAPVAGA